MAVQIILLRGLTPTGKNSVPMAPLRAALEAAGLRDVRTYIQSGNVIARTTRGERSVEKLVHEVIAERFGGDIPVLARPVSYFRAMLARTPFKPIDPPRLYYTLLQSEPERARLEALLATDFAPDAIENRGDMIYVRCATRYSEIKVNNNYIERKLQVAATTRVYNTIAKLVELGEAR